MLVTPRPGLLGELSITTVVTIFKEYIHNFLEVYFDDLTVFGLINKHIGYLRLMLDKCRQYHISLNLKKCIFCAPFGILLGHIVCRQGLMVDHEKISIIVNLPAPNSVIEDSTWSYWVLQKIHQGICKDYSTDGKAVKERREIPME